MIVQKIIEICTNCKSENIVKNGKTKTGQQKYHCKDCKCYRTLIKNDKTYAPLGAVPGLALYLAGYIREWRSKTPKNINYRMMNAGAVLSTLGLFGVIIKEHLQKTKKHKDKNFVYPEITKKQKKYYQDKISQKCDPRVILNAAPLLSIFIADLSLFSKKFTNKNFQNFNKFVNISYSITRILSIIPGIFLGHLDYPRLVYDVLSKCKIKDNKQ